VIETDLADKLNRISSTAKLDAVLNGSDENIADVSATDAVVESKNSTTTNGHANKTKKSHKSKVASSTKTTTTTTKSAEKSKLDKLKRLKHMQEKLLKQTDASNETRHGKENGKENSEFNFKKIDSQLITELHKITSELITKSGGSLSKSKKAKIDMSPEMTTKHEISKVKKKNFLNFYFKIKSIFFIANLKKLPLKNSLVLMLI
jgi:hypothetical protein